MAKIMGKKPVYSYEPVEKQKFTEDFDRFYTKAAFIYDIAVKMLPVWKTWLKKAIPHIKGPRVLEVSFGTGYLLSRYADRFDTHGIDYNRKMVSTAKKNLFKKGISAHIREGNVESMPYEDEFFDTVINTMAFSGYPDGIKAMSEIHRVLKSGGRLILIDIEYPGNRNRMGMICTKFWSLSGDIIRDMDKILGNFGFDYEDIEIGGFGSVHLFLAEKT